MLHGGTAHVLEPVDDRSAARGAVAVLCDARRGRASPRCRSTRSGCCATRCAGGTAVRRRPGAGRPLGAGRGPPRARRRARRAARALDGCARRAPRVADDPQRPSAWSPWPRGSPPASPVTALAGKDLVGRARSSRPDHVVPASARRSSSARRPWPPRGVLHDMGQRRPLPAVPAHPRLEPLRAHRDARRSSAERGAPPDTVSGHRRHCVWIRLGMDLRLDMLLRISMKRNRFVSSR